ncbi:hypothetical protein ACU686_44390 [Yinghuangia aomiensis]
MPKLTSMFGGLSDPVTIAGAVQFGLLEPEDDTLTVFRVPSPRELAVSAELHAAGVPVHALLDYLQGAAVRHGARRRDVHAAHRGAPVAALPSTRPGRTTRPWRWPS